MNSIIIFFKVFWIMLKFFYKFILEARKEKWYIPENKYIEKDKFLH